MKKISEFILGRLGIGVLAVAPIYLAALLLLKLMKSFTTIVRPLAKLLPKWLPAEHVLSVLLVLIGCFLIGLMVRTPTGRATWERMQNSLLQKIPGYSLFRSLTQQLAGKTQDQAWKPALAEIEEALVPAFIIEKHDDGRFTVFVPSVPMPLAGAIYILSPDRVHPLDVPFTRAIKAVSNWGAGSKDLVAAMERTKTPAVRPAMTCAPYREYMAKWSTILERRRIWRELSRTLASEPPDLLERSARDRQNVGQLLGGKESAATASRSHSSTRTGNGPPVLLNAIATASGDRSEAAGLRG